MSLTRRDRRWHRTSELATTLTALAEVWSTRTAAPAEPAPAPLVHIRIARPGATGVHSLATRSLTTRRPREVPRAS